MRTAIAASFVVVLVLGIVAVYPFEPGDDLIEEAGRLKSEKQESIRNHRYSILIDYNRPVFVKRLWVVDHETGKPVVTAHVSHARKSGFLFAKRFSNVPESHTSCAGSFVSQNSYRGRFGYSMRIAGLDEGVNDNCLERAIVFHKSIVPWSNGCFATFPGINQKIIDLTENGTFIYVRRSK